MRKLIDLTYYTNNEYTQPKQVIEAHKEALGYMRFIRSKMNVQIIKHINYEGRQLIDNVTYSFFKSKNRFFHIPFKTHKYIKREQPDVVLVQGFGFSLQVIFLSMALSGKCKILVQHHGEAPASGWKRLLQKLADKHIDAYLFTAIGNAAPQLKKGIISSIQKCHEVLEASTYFIQQDKHSSRLQLGIKGKDIFLWVGRLATKKDPITVLLGFEQYLKSNITAQLYMIYQEDDLLAEVKVMINAKGLLKTSVHLIGKVEHDALGVWFSAADFYLSGSHTEAAGYALIEAMACGCIPVVTNIPPFKKIAATCGAFFEPGDPISLYTSLLNLPLDAKEKYSKNVAAHFKKELSFEKIAEDIYTVAVS